MKKTIFLTGATDGIGLETAKLLAADGHHLLLHGRNEEKLNKVKNELIENFPDTKIDCYVADLSIIDDVKLMAEDILMSGAKLDVIINNAGLLVSEDEVNEDGIDIRFVVNTIAPYLLCKLLIPALSAYARIINLASAAQMPIDWDVFINGGSLEGHTAYAQSKLGIIIWSIELAQKLEGAATVVSVNPKSFLGSKLVKSAYGRNGYDLSLGADILYRAALSDEFSNANGKYYDNDLCEFTDPHPYALSRPYREKLIDAMENFLSEFE